MHERNPYRSPPDFLALAEAFPALKPYIVVAPNGATIDFKNDASQRILTQAILHRDFDLKIELPPDRLCPPVPNRLNYILWLEDVIAAISLAAQPPADPTRVVRVLDVGTGASAIYPLLACRMQPTWVFSATEIDGYSIRYAQMNVQANNLQDRIAAVPASPNGPIFAPLVESDVKFDFTMSNPPFYGSREEVVRSADAKEFEPSAVCTGADVEMITPGGEASFVGKMVEESLSLRGKCRWFTSMLGKLSSLTHIVQLLRAHEIENYAITELIQGHTRRWVVAWSFDDVRLPDPLARLPQHGLQSIMPAKNTLTQPLANAHKVTQIRTALMSVLGTIDGSRVESRTSGQQEDVVDIVVSAAENTWSRAARRKKRAAMQVEEGTILETQLLCRIRCSEAGIRVGTRGDAPNGASPCQLVFDWVAGKDRALFESFASHVERKIIAWLAE